VSFVPAVAIIAKEKQVVAAFRAAGALSPAQARAPGELGVGAGIALRRLRRNAVLRETSEGALYLDQASWEALRARRRRFALTVVSSVVLAGLALFLYLYMSRK
jgi:hypothetical protein